MDKKRQLVRGEMTACFSGRFDPSHDGHLLTIGKLAKQYKFVNVVILDDGQRETPLCYTKKKLDLFSSFFNNIYVFICPYHFGRITMDQVKALPFGFDVYLSGNLDVLRHFEDLGILAEYVSRSFEDNATATRIGTQVQKALS